MEEDAVIWPSSDHEPRGCPTPGACSSAEIIEQLRAEVKRLKHDNEKLTTETQSFYNNLVHKMLHEAGVPYDALDEEGESYELSIHGRVRALIDERDEWKRKFLAREHHNEKK